MPGPSPLYRCSKCGKLFPTVYGTGSSQLCRGCKTGDFGASVPGIDSPSQIPIIEAVDGAGPFLGPVDVTVRSNGQEWFADPPQQKLESESVRQLNELTKILLQQRPDLGQFVGVTSVEVQELTPAVKPGERVMVQSSDSGVAVIGTVLPNGKIKLDVPMRNTVDGETSYVDMIDPADIESVAVIQGMTGSSPAPAVPQASLPSPHQAMLEPKRKFRDS